MPCPLLIFSQSDYLIWIVAINSHTEWQTVQIQNNWLLQKSTDLDLHCLQRQGISGFSRTWVNNLYILQRHIAYLNIWAPLRKNVPLDHVRTVKAQIRLHNAQSDLGLHCLLTESLDTTEYINGEQRPRWYLANAQDDLNLHILSLFKDSFSLDMAHLLLSMLGKNFSRCHSDSLVFYIPFNII